MTEESHPTERDVPRADPAASAEPPLVEVRDIGAASRSCLVIMVLAVAILLLVCVSWVVRVVF